jgi:hypothetical protein
MGVLYATPQSPCSNGWGSTSSSSSCTQSESSTLYAGTATVQSYDDANGIHVYASAAATNNQDFFSSSGPYYSWANADAKGAFSDTLTNNSGVAAGIQISFHVDGTLTVTPGQKSGSFTEADDGASLTIQLSGAESSPNWYYPNPVLEPWDSDTYGKQDVISISSPNVINPALTETIDQDFVTYTIFLAPGESYYFSITIDANANAQANGSSSPQTVHGTSDASDTLSITGLSAFNSSNNNPLPLTEFSSADGMNYSGIPEPGTLGLLAMPIGALLLRAWRRRQRM